MLWVSVRYANGLYDLDRSVALEDTGLIGPHVLARLSLVD